MYSGHKISTLLSHENRLPAKVGARPGPEGAGDRARCAGAATFVAPGSGLSWLEADPAAEGSGGADFDRPATFLSYAVLEIIFSRMTSLYCSITDFSGLAVPVLVLIMTLYKRDSSGTSDRLHLSRNSAVTSG